MLDLIACSDEARVKCFGPVLVGSQGRNVSDDLQRTLLFQSNRNVRHLIALRIVPCSERGAGV